MATPNASWPRPTPAPRSGGAPPRPAQAFLPFFHTFYFPPSSLFFFHKNFYNKSLPLAPYTKYSLYRNKLKPNASREGCDLRKENQHPSIHPPKSFPLLGNPQQGIHTTPRSQLDEGKVRQDPPMRKGFTSYLEEKSSCSPALRSLYPNLWPHGSKSWRNPVLTQGISVTAGQGCCYRD